MNRIGDSSIQFYGQIFSGIKSDSVFTHHTLVSPSLKIIIDENGSKDESSTLCEDDSSGFFISGITDSLTTSLSNESSEDLSDNISSTSMVEFYEELS